jgi:hypothetical protein
MTVGGGATAVHYAEFEGSGTLSLVWDAIIGVGRPGLDVEEVYVGASPHFWWGWDNDGNITHNNTTNKSYWAGRHCYTQDDTLGLLLDCAAGTLTAYKNGARLGKVVQSGLEGQLCWAASLYQIGSRLQLRAKQPPTGWRTNTTIGAHWSEEEDY